MTFKEAKLKREATADESGSIGTSSQRFTFYEFFAGGGMARAGLGEDWRCLFANDFDFKKSRTYRQNWGEGQIKTEDVRKLKASDLPEVADLVWGSFPCQDLSLAGGGAGLKGDRSGTFWPFWDLMKKLMKEDRAAKVIVLENVCGTLNSHGGKDFATICRVFASKGYRCGAVVVDAALFVPQSRPRLFIIGVRDDVIIPDNLLADGPKIPWHTRALKTAYGNLPAVPRNNWVWWNLRAPAQRNTRFADFIEEEPTGVPWHSPEETKRLLDMMSPVNMQKVLDAKASGVKTVGAIYKRTRKDAAGFKIQRAEIRFDEISGCLRTPAGGSSRQLIMVVEGNSVRSRLISSRETARLMGLDDDYVLPANYNEAYHLTGDGVVVPVVRHLAENIIEPILKC